MLFIDSSQGYNGASAVSIDASTTLDIVSGDVLVLIVEVDLGAHSITSVAEDDTSNALTIQAGVSGAYNVTTCYLLSASASTGATMRVTLSNNPNSAAWEFTCLQFRPESGESVSFGSGPASNSSGWGTNPISAQLSTTSTDSLFVGGAFNDRAALSSHLLGGSTPDGVVTGTQDFDVGYSVFSSTQSNITYGASSGSGIWAAQLTGIDITTSGGGISIPVVMHHLRQLFTQIIFSLNVLLSITLYLKLRYYKQKLLFYNNPDNIRALLELEEFLS